VQSGQAEVRTIRNIRFTEWGTARVAVRHGFVDLDDTADLNYLFAIHRHGVAQALPQMAIQQGLKRMSGAIATTYEHDSHNLFVAGGNSEDMQLAANALIESGGGMAVAQAGNLLAIVEMPVAGMLSLDAPEQVARKFREVREAAGLVTEWLPPYWRFKAIEGMSLICNPYPHLTDQGLIDGKTGERFEVVLSAIANA
jgi:adenine deaminase